MRQCVDDHSEGQVLRDESRFVAAREHFVACAMATCPDAIRTECDKLLTDLESRTPTLVLAARDDQQGDVPGVAVFLDGEPLADALNGRAVALDPGSHEFRFEAPDGRVQVARVVAREWVKGRPLEVTFPAPPPPEPIAPPPPTLEANRMAAPPVVDAPSSGSATATWGYVLGGVGVAALGGFGYFAYSGRSQKNELSKSCGTTCLESQADSVRTKYLIADVLLGVGLASLGTGTYLIVRSSGEGPLESHRGLLVGVGGIF